MRIDQKLVRDLNIAEIIALNTAGKLEEIRECLKVFGLVKKRIFDEMRNETPTLLIYRKSQPIHLPVNPRVYCLQLVKWGFGQ